MKKIINSKFNIDDFILYNGYTYKIIDILPALNSYKYVVRTTGDKSTWTNYVFFKKDEDYMSLQPNFKETFDLLTLKPYDKVLVRNIDIDEWHIDFFECIKIINTMPVFICMNHKVSQLIPYNEETKHLIGSKDLPPDFYINWQTTQ